MKTLKEHFEKLNKITGATCIVIQEHIKCIHHCNKKNPCTTCNAVLIKETGNKRNPKAIAYSYFCKDCGTEWINI